MSTAAEPIAQTALDVAGLRRDFPLVSRHSLESPLVYLDNAASAQKPRCVIDAMAAFAYERYANVRRGSHRLSDSATTGYEAARRTVARFINATSADEIVFVKSATEAINLVANGLSHMLDPGDEIIVSSIEHHANLVPWMMLRQKRGIVLRWIDPDPTGHLDPDAFAAAMNARTRLVAVSHMSNVLGALTPLKSIVAAAHRFGVPVLADGTQAVVHDIVDVAALDVDYYAFTGHKLYGPTGIGVLYGKAHRLDMLSPMLGGGEMVCSVSRDHVDFAAPPHRFEAGTPPILEAVGLMAALEYIEATGREAIRAHEAALGRYARTRIGGLPGVTVFGDPRQDGAIITFALDGAHANDAAAVVDGLGICIRAGAHCAQPLHALMGATSTCRASLAMYSTYDEVDALVDALHHARRLLC